jgi:hypothetical protein
VGLGRAAQTVDVEVWWPATDTRQQFSDVRKNQWLQIEEFAKSYSPLKREPVRLGGPGRHP